MKHKRLKYNLGTLGIILACIALIMALLNPVRADFNNAVFEGGKPNPMVDDQKVMDEIIEMNRQCYQNPKDLRVYHHYYVIFSIFDVKVSDTKTYYVLGIMKLFRVLNP